MASEQNKTLQALKAAIQMEIDGKECYEQASRGSGNEVGKQLLASLAAEEDTHRLKFVEIYNAISSKKQWPRTDFRPDKGEKLRALFAGACAVTEVDIKAASSEMDALNVAISKENESRDFYAQQSELASFAAEKEFYRAVAGEETEHAKVLLDYYEYLQNPAAYFVEKEHHSLDGG